MLDLSKLQPIHVRGAASQDWLEVPALAVVVSGRLQALVLPLPYPPCRSSQES